jgi:O-antigen ligase
LSSSRRSPAFPPEAAPGAGAAGSTFLLRPLTTAFFVVMLAGLFSLDRIGIENPFLVPERLVGFGLVAFLVLVISLANRRAERSRRASGIVVAAPLVYFLVTSLWGADVPEYWAAVTDVVCMILACFIISILLQWDTLLVAETLLWCLAATGLIYAVAGLASASSGGQVSAFGGGPNVFSRITVLGFIGLVGLVALNKVPIAALALGPIMLVATVVSGSRGGMLAGLVAGCVLVPLVRRLKPFQVVAGLGLLVTCMIFVYQRYEDAVERVIDGRIVQLTLQQGYTSGRGDLFGSAWGLFQDNLLVGAGLRGFAEHYGQGFTYPHNLFLLVASEGGLVGLVILLSALVTFAVRVLRHHGSTLTLLYTSAASVIFTSSMFSGDYYDSRFLWIFMMVALHTAGRPMTASERAS